MGGFICIKIILQNSKSKNAARRAAIFEVFNYVFGGFQSEKNDDFFCIKTLSILALSMCPIFHAVGLANVLCRTQTLIAPPLVMPQGCIRSTSVLARSTSPVNPKLSALRRSALCLF